MGKECKQIKEDLIDIFYAEKEMDEVIEMHLKDCHECMSYWESLYSLKDDLSVLDTVVDANDEEILKAFETAEKQQNTRKERTDFIIFLLGVIVIMSFVVSIAAMGYGTALIIVQMAIAASTSLIIPLALLLKLRREET